MRSLTSDQPEALLQQLRDACGLGVAEAREQNEDAFLKGFLPIRRHCQVLEVNTQLVLGERGAGKSELFRVLSFENGRRALSSFSGDRGYLLPQLDSTRWVVGFETTGQEFPPTELLASFGQMYDVKRLERLWLGLLARVLIRASLPLAGLPPHLRKVLNDAWIDIEPVVAAVESDLGVLYAALDGLDRALAVEEQYVFVTYDDLDRLGPGRPDTMLELIRGLVMFWDAIGRRWFRLKPKVFLRRDLFHRALRGPDAAKMAAHRAELEWDENDYYAVLLKRILNAPDPLGQWLSAVGLRTERDEILGVIPQIRQDSDYRPAVVRLIGEYMGLDPRRGFSWRWVLNHLKDGRGRLYPRPLFWLIQEAVDIELREHRAAGDRLLHWTAMRGGLDRVSEQRVTEMTVEFPWLSTIKEAFTSNPFLVPADRREVRRALNFVDWKRLADQPPSANPDDLIDYLIELGVASERSDRRIDIGDLYLRGLGLRRKGGVARPRASLGGT